MVLVFCAELFFTVVTSNIGIFILCGVSGIGLFYTELYESVECIIINILFYR